MRGLVQQLLEPLQRGLAISPLGPGVFHRDFDHSALGAVGQPGAQVLKRFGVQTRSRQVEAKRDPGVASVGVLPTRAARGAERPPDRLLADRLAPDDQHWQVAHGE